MLPYVCITLKVVMVLISFFKNCWLSLNGGVRPVVLHRKANVPKALTTCLMATATAATPTFLA